MQKATHWHIRNDKERDLHIFSCRFIGTERVEIETMNLIFVNRGWITKAIDKRHFWDMKKSQTFLPFAVLEFSDISGISQAFFC